MICRNCGYENQNHARYCSGCGRKFQHCDWRPKMGLILAAVCLLMVGIGIGSLLPGRREADGAPLQEDKVLTDTVSPKTSAVIAQVLPNEDGSVAVLYTDGTVRVSGNRDFSEAVADWSNVSRVYYDEQYHWESGESHCEATLYGLTEDGKVLATDGSLSGWSGVKELHFSWQGIVGVTKDGRVLAKENGEDLSFLTSMSDVECLVFAGIQDIWGCLHKDGSVSFNGEYIESGMVRWTDVKELRDSGHSFYAIKNDGTVVGGVEDDQSGLNDAVKIVDYEDWLFGISADGRLLTYNGGSIYTNTGDMMVDVPGLDYYGEEVDIRQFDQIADIVSFRGLILLNRDGTAEHIGAYPHWDLSAWNGVQKVCGCDVGEYKINLYGIQRDGSVAVNQYDTYHGEQTVITQYRDWILQDIYAGEEGVVGLTTDGQLVGDGIYENVDFSVFE